MFPPTGTKDTVIFYAGMTLMYCGLEIIEWSDFKTSFTTIETRVVSNSDPLGKYLSVSRVVAKNTKDVPSTELLPNNSSLRNTSYNKPVSMKANKRYVGADSTVSSTTAREIKNLYDSDLVRSHGVKLQWMRDRMIA